MKKFVLERESYTLQGTFGRIFDGDKELCCTYELPWFDNKVSASCIPEGIYECEVFYHPKRGRVVRVKDVPGRTDILMHVGNTRKDTYGCILPGMYHFIHGVRKSVYGLGKLMLYFPDTFLLEVISKEE